MEISAICLFFQFEFSIFMSLFITKFNLLANLSRIYDEENFYLCRDELGTSGLRSQIDSLRTEIKFIERDSIYGFFSVTFEDCRTQNSLSRHLISFDKKFFKFFQ